MEEDDRAGGCEKYPKISQATHDKAHKHYIAPLSSDTTRTN
jgi:hypothetical protein